MDLQLGVVGNLGVCGRGEAVVTPKVETLRWPSAGRVGAARVAMVRCRAASGDGQGKKVRILSMWFSCSLLFCDVFLFSGRDCGDGMESLTPERLTYFTMWQNMINDVILHGFLLYI